MHPAPSIILFTTLSGLGFGLLIWLGVDPTPPTGWVAFAFYAIAYALALSGLAASSFHLGRRDRALKAFRQWRTSWLSREAWMAALALGHPRRLVIHDLLELDRPEIDEQTLDEQTLEHHALLWPRLGRQAPRPRAECRGPCWRAPCRRLL